MLYLPQELTVKATWNDFLDITNITCGYAVYRCECRKLHISFAKLGREECAKCVTLDSLEKYEHEQEARRRPTARCEEAVYTLDTQRVILLPRIEQYK